MRKIAILIVTLLVSSFSVDIANSQTELAPLPPNYRAQIVQVISKRYDLTQIRDAGITPPVKKCGLFLCNHWMFCVATVADFKFGDRLFGGGLTYSVISVWFNNGQAEVLGSTMVNGRGSATNKRLNVGGCGGKVTSPFPEIVRGKPLS